MIWLILLLVPTAAPSEKGEALFTKTCTNAYCHGAGNTAGRAPAIPGKALGPAVLRRTVTFGNPDRGMPPFGKMLSRDEISLLVGHSQTTGPEGKGEDGPIVPKLSGDLAVGRELFFDAARLPSCSACHDAAGIGNPLAGSLGPSSDLTRIVPKRVVVAVTRDDSFPAIVEKTDANALRLYDLSARLPVLRVFGSDEVKVQTGSNWSHAAVSGRYTRKELELIRRFLRR